MKIMLWITSYMIIGLFVVLVAMLSLWLVVKWAIKKNPDLVNDADYVHINQVFDYLSKPIITAQLVVLWPLTILYLICGVIMAIIKRH